MKENTHGSGNQQASMVLLAAQAVGLSESPYFCSMTRPEINENFSMNVPTKDGSFQITIASDLTEARLVQDEIESHLHVHHFADKDIFAIKLALEEALVNAIKHGNQLDPDKTVSIQYRIDAPRFEITVRDEGNGFNPDDLPDPLAVENLERPCGRGLLLIRHYMTKVEVQPPGNCLTMMKMCQTLHPNGQLS